MPATDVKFGITRHEGALIDSVDTTEKINVAELKGSNGSIARVHPFGETTDFSVKGHGALTMTPGVGDSDIEGVEDGVSVIKEIKRSETNDNFDGWEYSGTNYPDAEEVA